MINYEYSVVTVPYLLLPWSSWRAITMKQAYYISLLLAIIFYAGISHPAVAGPAKGKRFVIPGRGVSCVKTPNAIGCLPKKVSSITRFAVGTRLVTKGVRIETPPKVTHQILEITSAKTLKIKFLGYKELTGIYAINADATVSIPVLGRISVANIDAAELEKILSKKVTNVTGRKGYATVEVIAYRPVFVTGVVKDSKSFSWTPGMTVLHAVTLAGGTSRLASGGVNIPLSANSQRSRLQQATNKLKRSIAKLARLRAERTGKNKLSVSPELVKLVGKAEAEDLIAAQNEVLNTNSRAYNNQYQAIKQAITTAEGEFKAMKKKERLIKRQMILRKKHHERLRNLKKRHLVTNTSLIKMETRIAETEEKNVAVMLARAALQGRLLDLQRELLIVKQKKEGKIDQEILGVERQAAEYRINMNSAHKAMQTLYGGATVPEFGQKFKPAGFKIVRQSAKGARTLSVDKFTQLRPGDIVVVSN